MKAVRTIAALAILAIAAFVPLAEAADADSIVVVDGVGNTFNLPGPTDRIITVGTGITATVIGVGGINKIAVCDNYAANNSDPIFDGLRTLISQGKVLAGGNIYSSGIDQLKKDIIYASDPATGSFDKEKDVVVVTGSETYRNNIVPYLADKGFKFVMQWADITEYRDIIGFAETVSTVCNGSVVKAVEEMEYVSDYIEDTLEKKAPASKDAFYVTFSANVFKVGNKGSLATSMISAAGGNAFTVDPSKQGSTYEANITNLVSEHVGCIVFVDNTIASDQDKLKMLEGQIGDKATTVPLQNIWNNYTLKSAEGLWVMACALYPDLFEGDVPSVDDGSDADPLVYVGAGIALVAVVLIGSYFFIWRKP